MFPANEEEQGLRCLVKNNFILLPNGTLNTDVEVAIFYFMNCCDFQIHLSHFDALAMHYPLFSLRNVN